MLHAWKYLLVSDLIIASGFNLYFPKIWLSHKANTLRLNDCLFPEGKKLKVDFKLQEMIETNVLNKNKRSR